jgi:serine protease Do
MGATSAFVYYSRGLIYSAIGRHNDAVNDISMAISLDPKWIELFVDRGMIRAKAGQYEAAISDFNRAIELKSDLIWAFRERGLTYMRIGNRDKARSDLSIALRSQPDDIEVIAALRDLEPPSLSAEAPNQKDTPKEISGTGFFVAPKQVLTNNHVIKDCRTNPIRVSYPERRPERAYIVGQDDTNDLAVLQTELANTSVASFRFSARLGEAVAAYGFPFRGLLSSSGNFTLGNVTSLTGMNDDTRLLQTSTPIQPGNSGGPLLDMSGSVIGVIVSQLNAMTMIQVADNIPQNVNFAIQTPMVVNFLTIKGVSPTTADKTRPTLDPAGVADVAKGFTVQVTCGQ